MVVCLAFQEGFRDHRFIEGYFSVERTEQECFCERLPVKLAGGYIDPVCTHLRNATAGVHIIGRKVLGSRRIFKFGAVHFIRRDGRNLFDCLRIEMEIEVRFSIYLLGFMANGVPVKHHEIERNNGFCYRVEFKQPVVAAAVVVATGTANRNRVHGCIVEGYRNLLGVTLLVELYPCPCLTAMNLGLRALESTVFTAVLVFIAGGE